MIKIYQTRHGDNGNCLQTAYASLLNLDIHQVPDFREIILTKPGHFTGYLFDFLLANNVEYVATLVNKNYDMDDRRMSIIALHNYVGIDGFFRASVISPSNNTMTHSVIIDQEFNIVNPINIEYDGMEKFPRADEIGYNGIIRIEILKRIIK